MSQFTHTVVPFSEKSNVVSLDGSTDVRSIFREKPFHFHARAHLKKIQLIELEGKKYLINVSAKDKKLVEALGFAGLYDSPDAVLNALTKFR